jgi:hypothetical protein
VAQLNSAGIPVGKILLERIENRQLDRTVEQLKSAGIPLGKLLPERIENSDSCLEQWHGSTQLAFL